MINSSLTRRFSKNGWHVVAAGMLAAASISGQAQVPLAEQPLFTSIPIPGNVLLVLSVEYPTALSWAYPYSTNPYNPASTTDYLGYFDPAKCYTYQTAVTSPETPYFQPDSAATQHACTSTSAKPLWSGNWLNWASMQTIDTFRWALTGGYRSTDTASTTILERAWASGQGGNGETVDKTIPRSGGPASDVSGATPFTFSSVSSRVWKAGNQIWVSGSNATTLDAATPPAAVVNYVGQNSYDGSANTTAVYALNVRVKVCDPSFATASNNYQPESQTSCTQYGSNYKPEGLMQKYAMKMRFGAFGYLNDSSVQRDGGVLRENMKYVGPVQPVPGVGTTTNANPEWSATDGTFYSNPNSTDQSAYTPFANSGVMNYLNKFGETSHTYKTYDPVSELYYAGIRYFKNLGNVATYTNSLNATMADGFPVITNWTDPILYACQKNFIIGIGDVNTHADANLPGSTIGNASYETAARPTDTTVNVETATNMVGTLEGLGKIGDALIGDSATRFIAGLAYDSHTVDMRPCDFPSDSACGARANPKSQIQTVSTYWIDVQEYQAYVNNNQFYLATKYGGFDVPANFQPYASSNAKNLLTVGIGAGSTTPLTDPMWHTNSDTFGSNKRPDHYFSGGQADKMVAGLNSAFASIASQITGNTTAFSTTSATLTAANNLTYGSSYLQTNWTGDVIANQITYGVNGATFGNNIQWHAQTKLQAQTSRKIITAVSGVGTPFEITNLSSTPGYATFALVPDVATASQSSANFLNYLRGDQSLEVNASGTGIYRKRAFLLGDIVDSKVNPVGPPNSQFSDSANPGYGSFKSTYASRNTVVYVGANDGMMHAFDGSATGGTELFAYIPSFVYGTATTAPVNGLASLGDPYYTHHYFVDATPLVFDIDMNNTNGTTSTTPNWESVLIGGLAKGGKGYYAINVTDPSSWNSEATLASDVLWEFSDSRMGYSYGEPTVVKTKKYGWVVIFTSGFNNTDGVGYFFIVNPATGALLEAVSTGVGSATNQAGLTYASAYVADYLDGTADSVYAGDLLGNVWRLDLTTTSGSYAAPTKIAVLTDPSGVPQPVTSRPLIEVQPSSNKRYVLLGTGRLLAASDITNGQTESFYAITDGFSGSFYTSTTLPTGITFPVSRSNLTANTDLVNGIGSSPSGPMGWYIDLGSTNGIGARVTTTPTTVTGIVAFVANTPAGDICSSSGTGTGYAISFGSGKSALLDVNGNTLASIAFQSTIVDNQFFSNNGITTLTFGDIKGQTFNQLGSWGTSGSLKRLNWRELPTTD